MGLSRKEIQKGYNNRIIEIETLQEKVASFLEDNNAYVSDEIVYKNDEFIPIDSYTQKEIDTIEDDDIDYLKEILVEGAFDEDVYMSCMYMGEQYSFCLTEGDEMTPEGGYYIVVKDLKLIK